MECGTVSDFSDVCEPTTSSLQNLLTGDLTASSSQNLLTGSVVDGSSVMALVMTVWRRVPLGKLVKYP